MSGPRILSRREIEDVVAHERARGKRIVLTNGCFDLLHVGHVRCLEAAKAFGDVLIVGLNSDDSVRRLKGPGRPLAPAEDRAELLAALRPVDYVVIFEEDTPVELVHQVRPDVHVKGGEYRPQDMPETAAVESHGGRVEVVPMVPNRSTTSLMARVRKQ